MLYYISMRSSWKNEAGNGTATDRTDGAVAPFPNQIRTQGTKWQSGGEVCGKGYGGAVREGAPGRRREAETPR